MSNKIKEMAKNHLVIINAWDLNCEPKTLDGVNFCEVSPIPLNLDCTEITMNQANEIVGRNYKDDCCANGGGLWKDGDKNCWFTGSRTVATELVKLGAKVEINPQKQVRVLVKI